MSVITGKARSIFYRIKMVSGGILATIGRAIKRFNSNRGPEAAASISYYALFSLFPLLLLLVAFASNVLEQEEVQQQVLEYIIDIIPVSQDVITSQIETVLAARGAVGIIALLSFLWAASGVFNTLALHINRAWSRSNTRNVVHQRLVAIGIVAGLVGLTFVSLIATTVFNLLPLSRLSFWENLSTLKALSNVSSQAVPFIIRLAIFWVLYRMVPATRVKGSAAFWGALAAALAWELVTDGFTWFLSSGLVRYELIYGSLGAIIALLFWIYLISGILLFGAYLTAAIDESAEQETQVTA